MFVSTHFSPSLPFLRTIIVLVQTGKDGQTERNRHKSTQRLRITHWEKQTDTDREKTWMGKHREADWDVQTERNIHRKAYKEKQR